MCNTVHPHTCGVYSGATRRRAMPSWFIPTHVGFTFTMIDAVPFSPGSSPHMWGLRESAGAGGYIGRFIPTHVGFTQRHAFADRGSAVHPHTCGVYISLTLLEIGISGSSPHMWGLRGKLSDSLQFLRFIPTHVGFTGTFCKFSIESTVHPHTCGVYRPGSSAPSSRRGSSPHMWGLRVQVAEIRLVQRFIPTHVGFTLPEWL